MIRNKFIDTINEYKLLEPGDHVLVAVSGGVDSTALLHLLDSYKQELKITLHVAYLNHMIRKDAELDVRYVQDLAQNLRIPITVEMIDVQAFAQKEKLGLEVAARQVRYDFYERIAKRVCASKIAVGHTADDNVETFLMRLVRGSGMKGLCGIPPKRGKIIRPLIRIWRKEIEDYVGALKLVPRQDYTNYESKYMRNRVRLKLIPQLKLYNLNIKELILQTILLITDDYEYLETKAEQALSEILLSHTQNELKLDIEKVKRLERPMQKHLIRKAIERVKGNLIDLSYTHVQDILENMGVTERWELHLPGRIFIMGDREKLIISHERPNPLEKRSYRYLLDIPGEVAISEIGKKLRASFVPAKLTTEKRTVAFIDYSALGKEVIVRNWSDGDRFCPLGMQGSKKLQDLFVDEKIPAEERDSIPIVESDGKIIWVGGVRPDERAKVTKNTKKVVKLELI